MSAPARRAPLRRGLEAPTPQRARPSSNERPPLNTHTHKLFCFLPCDSPTWRKSGADGRRPPPYPRHSLSPPPPVPCPPQKDVAAARPLLRPPRADPPSPPSSAVFSLFFLLSEAEADAVWPGADTDDARNYLLLLTAPLPLARIYIRTRAKAAHTLLLINAPSPPPPPSFLPALLLCPAGPPTLPPNCFSRPLSGPRVALLLLSGAPKAPTVCLYPTPPLFSPPPLVSSKNTHTAFHSSSALLSVSRPLLSLSLNSSDGRPLFLWDAARRHTSAPRRPFVAAHAACALCFSIPSG